MRETEGEERRSKEGKRLFPFCFASCDLSFFFISFESRPLDYDSKVRSSLLEGS